MSAINDGLSIGGAPLIPKTEISIMCTGLGEPYAWIHRV
jgi:hypothetical protein